MRDYELTVLLHPDLEGQVDTAIKKLHDIIKGVSGEITLEDNWGKKKLAYSIAKHDYALYVYFDLKLPAESLSKLSSTLNITDEVIRYLLVATDHKARLAAEQQKADEKEKQKEEEE
jgi:small subunit ribosomal protein S6